MSAFPQNPSGTRNVLSVDDPTFSVVIATKNRPNSLRACLESFLRLDYPAGRWELILVNDGGHISFAGITPEIRDRLPIRFLNAPRSGGPGYARNLGGRTARGEYLAFTDDDCRVAPDWLSGFDRLFRTQQWDAAGGLSLNPYDGNTAGEAWNSILGFLYEYRLDSRGNVILVVTVNAAVKRDVWLSLGGFDESFTIASEDREFSYRLIASGFRQTFCPEARVWHHQRKSSAANYLRLQFRYGRGAFHFHCKIRRTGSCRNVVITPKGPRFYPWALWSDLVRKRTRFAVIALITGGQIVHRFGRYYAKLRHLIDRPS
jgi:GT2 family glycosyltransferase